jgi:hypothetical protein
LGITRTSPYILLDTTGTTHCILDIAGTISRTFYNTGAPTHVLYIFYIHYIPDILGVAGTPLDTTGASPYILVITGASPYIIGILGTSFRNRTTDGMSVYIINTIGTSLYILGIAGSTPRTFYTTETSPCTLGIAGPSIDTLDTSLDILDTSLDIPDTSPDTLDTSACIPDTACTTYCTHAFAGKSPSILGTAETVPCILRNTTTLHRTRQSSTYPFCAVGTGSTSVWGSCTLHTVTTTISSSDVSGADS